MDEDYGNVGLERHTTFVARSIAVDAQQRDLAFFFFNDTATTEIYTLSLHDALPISGTTVMAVDVAPDLRNANVRVSRLPPGADRKSTRLNSSHSQISYAVFCLKKKTPTLGLEGRQANTR